MGGGKSKIREKEEEERKKKEEEERKKKEEEEKRKKKAQLNKIESVKLQCKKCRDDMNKYIKRIEQAAEKKKLKAKELVKNKESERAKIYLRQCKLYKIEIQNAENQKNKIEDQIMQIDSNTNLIECQKILSNGNQILKELQSKNNIEKWEKIKDDMDDLKAEQDEINDFLKNNNINEDEYNEDILKEMENMEKELNLPNANTGKIIIDNKEEKDEKEEKKISV